MDKEDVVIIALVVFGVLLLSTVGVVLIGHLQPETREHVLDLFEAIAEGLD